MYAKVIVDISHTQVDRVFEYKIPEGMDVRTGMRVKVPFGKMRDTEGIVIGLEGSTEYPADKIKEIICPLDDFCALTEEQIARLAELLEGYEPAHTNFQAMPASVRKTYTRAYFDAKTEAGRQRRIAWMVDRLNRNLKPM